MNSENEHIIHRTGKNDLSVIGNNNSIMEYSYAIVYVVGFVSAPCALVAIIMMALLYDVLVIRWLILVGLAVFLSLTAVSSWMVLLSLVWLIRASKGQPRESNGQFAAYYAGGKYVGKVPSGFNKNGGRKISDAVKARLSAAFSRKKDPTSVG